MMELSLNQIQTYLHCPAEYMFRYEKNIPAEDPLNTKYKKAIHKTVNYFYFSALGGFIPSAKQMKDKWATIWREASEGPIDASKLLFQSKRKEETSKIDKQIIQGYEMIHNFYHFNKDSVGIPIAVDHEFRVPIGGITVTGTFELIRESLDKTSPNRFIEIVDFKTGSEPTDMFLVNNDLNLTIMSYAFRNLFKVKEDRLTYNYLKTGKEIYTSRNERDYDRMKATVLGVAEGIANKRFYPRQTFMCKSCPFKDVCNMAKF